MEWLWFVLAAIVLVGVVAVMAWLFRPELDNDEQDVKRGRRRLRRLLRVGKRENR